MRNTIALFALAVVAAGAPEAGFSIPAEVLALRDVRVPAEVSGRVVARPENETVAVAKGEVVVALDDVFLRAAANAAHAVAQRAQARREWADIELRNEEILFKRGTAHKADLDRRQLAAREAIASQASAEAAAAEAQARLERAQIRAPFAGKLVRIRPEIGEYLRVGATAFRIIDDSALRVVAYVPAHVVAGLEVGQAVYVAPDQPDAKLPVLEAKIFSIAGAAEGKARTFRVEARAKDAPRRWLPGMTGRLRSHEDDKGR